MDKDWMRNWTSADPVPFARLLGIELLGATAYEVRGKLKVRAELTNPFDILHGGAIMTFADTLGAIGAFLNLPEGAAGTTTLESKTNFLRAASIGDDVLGVAVPLHRGRTTSVWQTTLKVGDRPIAIVTQTQLVLGT